MNGKGRVKVSKPVKDRQKDPKVTAHQLSSALRLELSINTGTTPTYNQ